MYWWMIIYVWIIFAVNHIAIATICIVLNIAIGYILLQYIVQLLPTFATNLILSSVISFCSILYRYCRHSLHTQYWLWLYSFAIYCTTVVAIRYTLNIAIGYILLHITIGFILLHYIVWLLPSFATHTILPLAISFSSIFYSYCCHLPHTILPLAISFSSILYNYCRHLLHTQYCHRLYPFVVFCTDIATICNVLNIAIGYILLQYFVWLLPPFATHSVFPLAISFCSILYSYCHHSLHTQYSHRLYPVAVYCTDIAVSYCYSHVTR